MNDEENYVSDFRTDEELTAIENREALESNLINTNNVWGYSNAGLEAKRAAMSMLSTKTGMYARIPILCKGDGCPYAETCQLLNYNLAPLGEPCPIETSQIEVRLRGYEEDFGIEKASFTDKVLITELINHDIMLERCKNLVTKEGTLVEDVVAGMNERGEEFTRPEILKEYEAYDKVLRRRNEIYDLMMATRRSRKGLGVEENNDSWSKTIADVMEDNFDFVIDEKPDGM